MEIKLTKGELHAIDRRACKYRLRAGELYADQAKPAIDDSIVQDYVKAAHDNLCKAFMRLEDIHRGVITRDDSDIEG